MKTERVTESNLNIIKGWWEAQGFPVIPEVCLPNYGWISFYNEKPICSAFLYTDGKSICAWLTWMVMNPEAKQEERSVGFKLLMLQVDKTAKDLGVKIIYSPTNNASLVKRFEENGYVSKDLDVVDMMKIIE